jgi:hypothetical protein
MSWEDSFQSWANPPGETEQQRCDNAVTPVSNLARIFLARLDDLT